MKRIIYILLCALGLIAVNACRVNNGDIGFLYGTWSLQSMKVDGVPYDGWRSPERQETFFSFQNNICFINYVDDHYQSDYRVATWEWKNDRQSVIALDFTHTEDRFPQPVPDGYLYGAPAWLLLSESVVYNFDVIALDDKNLTWSTVNTEGQHLEYHLKKTW